jgi:hypothetical protein
MEYGARNSAAVAQRWLRVRGSACTFWDASKYRNKMVLGYPTSLCAFLDHSFTCVWPQLRGILKVQEEEARGHADSGARGNHLNPGKATVGG